MTIWLEYGRSPSPRAFFRAFTVAVRKAAIACSTAFLSPTISACSVQSPQTAVQSNHTLRARASAREFPNQASLGGAVRAQPGASPDPPSAQLLCDVRGSALGSTSTG